MEPRPTDQPTFLSTPLISESPGPILSEIKVPIILSGSLPGDGGGCMAGYLGWAAPSFVLYSDGQLLVHNPDEDPWYSQAQLSDQELEMLLQQIENTDFFSVTGDGTQWEDDPIYQLQENFEKSMGGGTLYLAVHKEGLFKRVTVYLPYLEYVVAEVAGALQAIERYQIKSQQAYQPSRWVAWAGQEDPCEPYQLEYVTWTEGMPDVSALLHNRHGQLVFESGEELNYSQYLEDKPQTFIRQEGGLTYYIITRPLLPHEQATDFSEW